MKDLDSTNFDLENVFKTTKVGEIMRVPPPAIQISDDLSTAAEAFAEKKVSHLLVLYEDNKLAGLLTPKYLYKTQSPQKIISDQMVTDSNLIVDGESFYRKESLDTFILSQIIYKTPFTLEPDDLLASALISMSKKIISCIPIIDENRVVQGVLTSQEVVDFMTKIVKKIF